MKQDGRDLLAQFRALAPERPPDLAAALERPRASWLALLVVLAVLVGVHGERSACCTPAHDLGVDGTPTCGTGNVHDPDRAVGPVGDVGAVHRVAPGRMGRRAASQIDDERGRFWLDSDVAGDHAVEVTLAPARPSARSRGATEVPSDEVGMRRYERRRAAPARACAARAPTCSQAVA